jgi:hypothetical protein
MPYLAERFESAVSALVAEGSVKERLFYAYSEFLEDLEINELPRSLQAKFETLNDALHSVSPIGKEPCIRATIRKMSRIQAGTYAKTIVALYAELVYREDRAEPLQVVSRGKKEKAPRFVSHSA